MSRTVRNKKYFNQSDFKSKLNQVNDFVYGYKEIDKCCFNQFDLEDVSKLKSLLKNDDFAFVDVEVNKLYKKIIYKNFKDVTRETKCDLDRGFEKREYRKQRRKSNRMYDRNQISKVKKNYQDLDYIDKVVFKVTNQNYYLNYYYAYD